VTLEDLQLARDSVKQQLVEKWEFVPVVPVELSTLRCEGHLTGTARLE